MAYGDEVKACLDGAGIHIDANNVPDADTFAAVIKYASDHLKELDADVLAALDEALERDSGAKMLTQSNINAMDSSYNWLLEAFDQASGMKLSICLDWCAYCAEQAKQTDNAGTGS